MIDFRNGAMLIRDALSAEKYCDVALYYGINCSAASTTALLLLSLLINISAGEITGQII